MNIELNPAEKEEVALALLLLKDLRSDGRFIPQVTATTMRLAAKLGVQAELEKMMSQLPPTRVTLRDAVAEPRTFQVLPGSNPPHIPIPISSLYGSGSQGDTDCR